MTENASPKLQSDDHGVWRIDPDGRRFGISWDEIRAIAAGQLNCFTEHRSYLELEFENGHFFELYEDWLGFDLLLPVLAARFGLADDWFASVSAMVPGEEPIVFWRHP